MDDKRRYFLKKNERLRLKRGFTYLFEHGSSIRVDVLKFFYVFDMPEEYIHAPLSVAFTAPKRSFKKAVVRNRLKRRMREAYRLNKHILLDDLQRKERNLVVLVKYHQWTEVSYQRIEKAMVKALRKLKNKLQTLEADIHTND